MRALRAVGIALAAGMLALLAGLGLLLVGLAPPAVDVPERSRLVLDGVTVVNPGRRFFIWCGALICRPHLWGSPGHRADPIPDTPGQRPMHRPLRDDRARHR